MVSLVLDTVYVTRNPGNVYDGARWWCRGYSRYPAKASCWPPGWSIPIQPATLCPHPMPTGPWTVPTPLTTPELATTTTTITTTTTTTSGVATTINLLLPLPLVTTTHSPPLSERTVVVAAVAATAAPLLLLSGPYRHALTPTQFTSRPP